MKIYITSRQDFANKPIRFIPITQMFLLFFLMHNGRMIYRNNVVFRRFKPFQFTTMFDWTQNCVCVRVRGTAHESLLKRNKIKFNLI